ncbi:MAG: ABC transporter permease [Candidatus Onthomorpha sp.]|nr:ABC transporter permease [Bacteroidales bacterium]MDY4583880.1 ABC transporter permease [Candidatus Onthomorpha sp.]MCI5715567.1 ABC transporter permease [Bacteroidales bacterium]MCI6416042.1 ABC transporter permease [Bacteroidales bacterium]MCI6644420.1 ABC transporter permease [Bacteroidales bacterium]
MFNYIVKKVAYGLLVMLGVITLIFVLFNLLPGDPARMMLGQNADRESIEILHKELGLDKPVYVQYFNYLNDLSPIGFDKDGSFGFKTPDLRRSYQSGRSVSSILADSFPNTILLAVVSIAFAFVVGVSLGALAAIYSDTWFEKFVLVITSLGMSLPSFFAAILIAWFFAFILADYTGLSMFGSLYSVDDFGNGEYIDLKNLILPALTLGIRPLAVICELTKSTMKEVLQQDYIRTAKAKGLSKFQIITKHALRNTLNPVVSSISGWFASLIAGAVFVEYIFDWKGVGVVIVDSLEKYDFPVLMGSLIVICVMLIIINILTDITYAALDPRIKNE